MFGFIVMIILLFPLISFISALIAGMGIRKIVRKDDGAPEVCVHGKILEKHDDEFKPGTVGIKTSLLIEQLIFEDDQGNRIRLRNVKTKEIMLASGDTGRMTYRGETVYAFERDR